MLAERSKLVRCTESCPSYINGAPQKQRAMNQDGEVQRDKKGFIKRHVQDTPVKNNVYILQDCVS